MTLSGYINESLTKTQRMIVGSIVIDMLKGSRVTNEQLRVMFNNLELDILENINDYLYTTDKENFIAYSSDKDEFLIKSNKEKIVNKLVDYLGKSIVNID